MLNNFHVLNNYLRMVINYNYNYQDAENRVAKLLMPKLIG